MHDYNLPTLASNPITVTYLAESIGTIIPKKKKFTKE